MVNISATVAIELLALLAVAALAATLTASTVALAAPPKKCGLYVGELLRSDAVSKKIRMRISASGSTAKARLFCGGVAFSSTQRFKIGRGSRFTGTNKAGSLLVWRIRGRFASRTKARAKLYLPASCDGKGGSITLNLKT